VIRVVRQTACYRKEAPTENAVELSSHLNDPAVAFIKQLLPSVVVEQDIKPEPSLEGPSYHICLPHPASADYRFTLWLGFGEKQLALAWSPQTKNWTSGICHSRRPHSVQRNNLTRRFSKQWNSSSVTTHESNRSAGSFSTISNANTSLGTAGSVSMDSRPCDGSERRKFKPAGMCINPLRSWVAFELVAEEIAGEISPSSSLS
jgi:hypothetical protein